ncbi:hypothetical protein SAMN02799624_02291 [Paenibacillus sp. UNC496MF]|nr:hypothetical protein SAMN02799624_02291 [Paenibacillus sp. UNC496MF]
MAREEGSSGALVAPGRILLSVAAKGVGPLASREHLRGKLS